jgi:hypothetical protein
MEEHPPVVRPAQEELQKLEHLDDTHDCYSMEVVWWSRVFYRHYAVLLGRGTEREEIVEVTGGATSPQSLQEALEQMQNAQISRRHVRASDLEGMCVESSVPHHGLLRATKVRRHRWLS